MPPKLTQEGGAGYLRALVYQMILTPRELSERT